MIDVDELKILADEWLETLPDDKDFWDAVYASDQNMARLFLYGSGKDFIGFVESRLRDNK